MNPVIVFFVVAGYFGILLTVAWFTSRKADTDTFFIANRRSPWYLVAFAMIGATISGVTFISVPGEVGTSGFSYFQFILGNLVGYWLVAGFLLPLYYRLNLITIYTFLGQRFGRWSHKTGSFFFILSKLIGAAFRLYLAASVLQIAFFDAFNIPFAVTVLVSILLIWVYTFKGGIKTIIWTDSLQTFFLIGAVILTIVIISRDMGWSLSTMTGEISRHPLSNIFTWDWRSGNNFFKQFFGGVFITLVIVGMDQDSMQKNLTCRTLREARKNMFTFSLAFVVTVFLFLCLGAMLYIYAEKGGIQLPAATDDVYPWLAFNKLGMAVGIAFLIGVIAAAYSSADSALTSLTTTLSIDFFNAENLPESQRLRIKSRAHILFSFLLALIILIFKAVNDQSVVVAVFTVAGYTYGPILGLFLFGLISRRKIRDRMVPYIAVAAPALSWIISANSEKWLFGYTFGFEILILNGLLMITGLLLISKKA